MYCLVVSGKLDRFGEVYDGAFLDYFARVSGDLDLHLSTPESRVFFSDSACILTLSIFWWPRVS